MEKIHLKTVDPVSQNLLRQAAAQGIPLLWERFESQQPQDGFVRMGLSCPFGCGEGPCRIDPFARGAAQGVCGLSAEGMVAASLLQRVLNGVGSASCPGEPLWPRTEALDAACAKLGGGRPECRELFSAARALSRPGHGVEKLLGQALRLGLLSLGLREAASPADRAASAGWGTLAGDKAAVAVSGPLSEEQASELLQAAAQDGVPVVSLGGWIAAGEDCLPIACSSGEAELALVSGRVGALVCGCGTDPSLKALAQRLGITAARADDLEPAQMVSQAAGHNPGPDAAVFDSAWTGKGQARLGGTPDGGDLVVLAGSDAAMHSLGHLASALPAALKALGLDVAATGDAAVWALKADQAGGGSPVSLLDPAGWPGAVMGAAAEGRIKAVCFCGLKTNLELAQALGLAALGLRVAVAQPLPLAGSALARDALEALLGSLGGELKSWDHAASPDEVLGWLDRG